MEDMEDPNAMADLFTKHQRFVGRSLFNVIFVKYHHFRHRALAEQRSCRIRRSKKRFCKYKYKTCQKHNHICWRWYELTYINSFKDLQSSKKFKPHCFWRRNKAIFRNFSTCWFEQGNS